MRSRADEGFGLVEVVIAMFLLGLIAVAMLPVLWNSIAYSTEQSSVATATRHLNSVVDRARQTPSCGNIAALLAAAPIEDGKGNEITTRLHGGAALTCPASDHLVDLWLEAVGEGEVLATVHAKVYVP